MHTSYSTSPSKATTLPPFLRAGVHVTIVGGISGGQRVLGP